MSNFEKIGENISGGMVKVGESVGVGMMKFGAGMSKVLKKTAHHVEKNVAKVMHDVTGPKAVRDYELGEQVASAGIGLIWKVYDAKPRKTEAHHMGLPASVSVWVLDKKAVTDKLRKDEAEEFLELCRKDWQAVQRVRHPGIIRVIEPFDETRGSMAVATEPVAASLANVLGATDNLPKQGVALQDIISNMSHLETKHGFTQMAETLQFLHVDAKIIHRSINPQTIIITSSGSWKLSNLCFSTPPPTFLAPPELLYLYKEKGYDESATQTRPPLAYVAPEEVNLIAAPQRMVETPLDPAVDIFSLGCVIYEALLRTPLLPCGRSLMKYKESLAGLPSTDLSSLPNELAYLLSTMVAVDPGRRPAASLFLASGYFKDDPLLRALQFLDKMLGMDSLQKSQFLATLGELCKRFDPRVLKLKVLPPLLAELRNANMQAPVLPIVFNIAALQEPRPFQEISLPHIQPLMATANGEVALLLLQGMPILLERVTQQTVFDALLPMTLRLFDDPDMRVQEEVLRKAPELAAKVPYDILTGQILPRVHAIALKTTIAAVRVNAFRCLGSLVPRLDRAGVQAVMQTLARCVAVDKSPPTCMCALGVGDIVAKQEGPVFTAEVVLPILLPLTVSPRLNVGQFSMYMKILGEMFRSIEDKRRGELAENGMLPSSGTTPSKPAPEATPASPAPAKPAPAATVTPPPAAKPATGGATPASDAFYPKPPEITWGGAAPGAAASGAPPTPSPALSLNSMAGAGSGPMASQPKAGGTGAAPMGTFASAAAKADAAFPPVSLGGPAVAAAPAAAPIAVSSITGDDWDDWLRGPSLAGPVESVSLGGAGQGDPFLMAPARPTPPAPAPNLGSSPAPSPNAFGPPSPSMFAPAPATGGGASGGMAGGAGVGSLAAVPLGGLGTPPAPAPTLTQSSSFSSLTPGLSKPMGQPMGATSSAPMRPPQQQQQQQGGGGRIAPPQGPGLTLNSFNDWGLVSNNPAGAGGGGGPQIGVVPNMMASLSMTDGRSQGGMPMYQAPGSQPGANMGYGMGTGMGQGMGMPMGGNMGSGMGAGMWGAAPGGPGMNANVGAPPAQGQQKPGSTDLLW
eukprot:jgi/Mesvir1/10701/Mv13789-RA.1